jgi:hypothetical protein
MVRPVEIGDKAGLLGSQSSSARVRLLEVRYQAAEGVPPRLQRVLDALNWPRSGATMTFATTAKARNICVIRLPG